MFIHEVVKISRPMFMLDREGGFNSKFVVNLKDVSQGLIF